MGRRTAWYTPSPIRASRWAICRQASYSISSPVSSSFIRSPSSLRGKSRKLFICTSRAAMAMNSLEISSRFSRTRAITAVYCSINSKMGMSCRSILLRRTR